MPTKKKKSAGNQPAPSTSRPPKAQEPPSTSRTQPEDIASAEPEQSIPLQRMSEPEPAKPDAQLALERTQDESLLRLGFEMALRRPRNIKEVIENVIADATDEVETAEAMNYRLERRNKKTGVLKVITGLSIRAAEILRNNYGNFYVIGRSLGHDSLSARAGAYAIDFETGAQEALEISIRITDSTGRLYGDDMIIMATNAGISKARRNVILSLVPVRVKKALEKAVRSKLARSDRPIAERWESTLAWYRKVGVSENQLYSFLGRKAASEITADDLVKLTEVRTAIVEGHSSVEEQFPSRVENGGPSEPPPPPSPAREPKADSKRPEPPQSLLTIIAGKLIEKIAPKTGGVYGLEIATPAGEKLRLKTRDPRWIIEFKKLPLGIAVEYPVLPPEGSSDVYLLDIAKLPPPPKTTYDQPKPELFDTDTPFV